MNADLPFNTLSASARFEAVSSLLAAGFLRLQPQRLERLRSLSVGVNNSAPCPSISLDKGVVQSVHAIVNQE